MQAPSSASGGWKTIVQRAIAAILLVNLSGRGDKGMHTVASRSGIAL